MEKPFTEVQFLKDSMMSVADILCPEKKRLFNSIGLSTNTVAERIKKPTFLEIFVGLLFVCLFAFTVTPEWRSNEIAVSNSGPQLFWIWDPCFKQSFLAFLFSFCLLSSAENLLFIILMTNKGKIKKVYRKLEIYFMCPDNVTL